MSCGVGAKSARTAAKALVAAMSPYIHDRGIIKDFSEDGWVLYNREWYPYTTFIERYNLIHESI